MKLFPTSIVGRTALVLLVGLTVSHTISLALYSDDRRTELTSFGGQQISRRIAAAVETIERAEPARIQEVTRSLWGPDFSLTLTPQSAVTMHDARGWRARGVRETLAEYLDGYDADRIRVTYIHVSETMSGPVGGAAMAGDPMVAMRRHMGQMMAGIMPEGVSA